MSMPSLIDETTHAAGTAPSPGPHSSPRAVAAAARKNLKLIASCVMLALATIILIWQFSSGPISAAKETSVRDLIDIESSAVFLAEAIPLNSTPPWLNPKTGKPTLVAAEKCFWTKDGKAKLKPTYVLLNEYQGKPGPTICPDCGKRVTIHNAIPPVQLLSEAAGEPAPTPTVPTPR